MWENIDQKKLRIWTLFTQKTDGDELHYHSLSLLRISDMSLAGLELAQNVASDSVNWIYAIIMITTTRSHYMMH